MQVGDRVVVRDAFNRLKPAIVVPVPGGWRDSSMSQVVTCRGAFRKVWVKFPDTGHVAPWPLSDVFTDLAQAKAKSALIDGSNRLARGPSQPIEDAQRDGGDA